MDHPNGHSEAVTEVRSVDGTRISFDRSGQGPNVVVVSSALSDRADAKRLARHLSQHFTVTNYDRRGRGHSGDTFPYSVDREVEDIEALIDEAGGSASLFGSSSGAVLALEAASRLPDKVTHVAMFEPPFIVDDSRPPLGDDFTGTLEEHLDAGRPSQAVAYFMTDGLGMPGAFVAVMRLLPMWRKMKRIAHTLRYDLAILAGTQSGAPLPGDRWPDVSAPTLVITGSKSEPFLHRGAAALVDVLPCARAQALEGANHSAVVAAPKKLAAVVSEFLQER